MNIAPKDILEKEFGKKFNGYDPEDVDSFLDEIIKQFESLLEENEDIIAKNESLKSELAKMRVKVDKLDDIEEKMMATVLTAQKNATGYVERAEKQAKRIVELANQNAKTLIESTQLQMEAVKQDIERYQKVINNFKLKHKAFIEEQQSFVDGYLIDNEELGTSAQELSKSINNLTQQSKALDEPEETTSIHLDEILQENEVENEGSESVYNLDQSTASLQEIVNEIIDD